MEREKKSQRLVWRKARENANDGVLGNYYIIAMTVKLKQAICNC